MNHLVEPGPKKTFKLTIKVGAADLENVREKVIDDLIKDVELPGFRRGMAPKNLAEKSLSEAKIKSEIVNRAVNIYYPQAIKEAHLAPIILPRIEVKQFELGQDLIFEATICEKPQIKLGDYAPRIRSLRTENDRNKILMSDGKPREKDNDKESMVNQLLETVLNCSEVEVSDLLIDEEVNHMLSRLIDQTSRLGMTVEQYLKSSNKSVEEIKDEYRIGSENSLKLEFLLYEMAALENIQVTEKEISDTIKAAPDQKSREELGKETNLNYVRSILLKNKVIEGLVRIYEENAREDDKL